jgi:hypothetical protein
MPDDVWMEISDQVKNNKAQNGTTAHSVSIGASSFIIHANSPDIQVSE